MTAEEAMQALNEYLRENKIEQYPIIDLEDEDTPPRVWMSFKTEPIGIEGELFFLHNCVEIRCFYGEEMSKLLRVMADSARYELHRLLNFINARLFPFNYFNPRMYITEDSGCDLTITTIVPYWMWEYLDDESGDDLYGYITRCCPDFLEILEIPIVSVCAGIKATEAIAYIKRIILNEN